MPLTTTASNLILNKILKGSDFTSPTDLYVSLHIGNPGSTGQNEVSGGSYTRQQVIFNSANNSNSVSTNELIFSSLPSCTITHVGIWGSGILWWTETLVSEIIINNGEYFKILVGDISISIDPPIE